MVQIWGHAEGEARRASLSAPDPIRISRLKKFGEGPNLPTLVRLRADAKPSWRETLWRGFETLDQLGNIRGHRCGKGPMPRPLRIATIIDGMSGKIPTT